MNAPAVSIKVARRFHELRRRYLGVRIGIVLSIALAALIAIWVAMSVCDYFWELPVAYRTAGALIPASVVLVWLGAKLYTIAGDTRQRRFASAVEDSFQDFGQRVRTVLETVDGRVSGPQEMLAALGHQTLGRWETLSPAQMIPKRVLLACGALALAAVVFSLGLLTSGGDMRIAMLRTLGNDIPYTNLKVTPGDARILEGTPVEISLQLTGRTNRDVMLRYRVLEGEGIGAKESADAAKTPEPESTEDDWIESDLVPIESQSAKEVASQNDRVASFAAEFGKAKYPVQYQFVTSVGTTSVYRIDVQPLIEAERIETEVQPPQYTQLESRSFTTTNVAVLERSLVHVTIETNYPLDEAQLEIGNKPAKLATSDAAIEKAEEGRQWMFSLPTDDSIHWRFTGSGADGTPMQPVKGRLRVRRDGAPALTFSDPPDEILVHTLAELPMRLQVSDDYGIAETGIVFQLGGDEEYVLTDWIGEQDADNTTRLRLEEILPLESFELTEQDFIGYYAYAVDNRGWGPQRSESDMRYIDIRPLRQFFAETDFPPSDNEGDQLLVQLNELIRRQRFLINRTRRLVKSSSVDMARQLGTIDRMVESQSELAGLTRFLAEFLVSRGNDDVEALNQAEAAMLQAADSLAAGSFDLALLQEEEALRALAEARRTLEIFMCKNPKACQQCALQLRQKLRREKPKTQQQLADTLKKIAATQTQLSAMACAICNQAGGKGSSGQSNRMGQSGTGQGSNQQAAQQGAQGSQSGGDQDSQQPQDAQNNQQGEKSDEQQSQQDGKPSGGDQGDQESEDASEDDPSLEEQREQLYARQTDLLERLEAIAEQLADRLSSSSLMAQRMKDAKSSMNGLATQARDGELDGYENESNDAADQLREMGMQLDALAADEPISRVSAIRDMTSALANMESDLAQRMNPRSSGGSANANDSQNSGGGQGRLAKQMQRRAETVEDVLKAPVETGDVESSEVSDLLQNFAEETEFLDQLNQTRDAAARIASSNGAGDESDEESSDQAGKGGQQQEQSDAENEDDVRGGLQRASEYAEVAILLDELYRQLAAPRLARLQKMEQQANGLLQRTGQGGEQEKELDPETRSGIRKLKTDLEQEGLGSLAEIMDETEWTDAKVAEAISEIHEAGATGIRSQSNFGLRGMNRQSSRLALIAVELQKRIQEMVLREISADRDAAVPAQYRRAVDRYFRVLAGEAETATSTSPMTGVSGNTMKPAGAN